MTDKVDVVELKPCPFCRGVAKLEDHRLLWAVRCETCTACVLGKRAPEPQSNEEAEATDWAHYRQTAIDAWNSRVDTSIPCTHPPGVTSCSWCGLKPATTTPIDNNQKPVGVKI